MSKKFTPEEIRESLVACYQKGGCTLCIFGNDPFSCNTEDGKTLGVLAAEAIEEQASEIARLREDRRWIPVEDRLPYAEWDDHAAKYPDEDLEVLVMIKGAKVPTALYFNDEGEFYAFDDYGSETFYLVTHWMPMPAPPKEVQT